MAKQLLAETVVSEMEQDIEEMQLKRAAMRLAFQNKTETGESLSTADQETLERPPLFDTEAQSNEDIDLTSNEDICSSTAFRTFDSVYMSVSGQQFESSNSIAPASENRILESEVNIEDHALSSAESLTFSKGIAQKHHKRKIKRTAVAILNCLVPGINWNVAKNSRIKVGSPLKEFVVSMNVNGKTFEGRSSARHLARQYAAEATLNKLFGLEFERNDVGMPLFHGNLAEIAHLKKRKPKNTNSLDAIDGKNLILILNALFKDEVSFQFHSHLAPERALKHCCTVSVAGMTFEGCDSSKKNAKRQAAFAAVAVLRANGMYDQKVAELEARHTGMPVQQVMVKQRAQSSPINARSTPASRTKSYPLPVSVLARLNRLFPGYTFTLQAEKVDFLKGKIFTVDLLIGDQRFVGNGKRLRFARADAAKQALRAFGFWTDLDDKAEAQIHLLSEKEKKKEGFHLAIPPSDGSFKESFLHPVLHKKKLVKGRGKKCSTARRIKRYNNSPSIDSSYFGTENDDNNDILIDGDNFGTGNKRARFVDSGADSGYNVNRDVLIDGSFYGTGNKLERFMNSETERGCNGNSDVLIDRNYYSTGNMCARFTNSGAERGYNEHTDVLIGRNYYGTGNIQARFTNSGAERRYHENNDVLIGRNYYGSENCHKLERFMNSEAGRGYIENSDEYEQVRFVGSGIKRRNDKSNDILIDPNCYDTGDKKASFWGSTVSFAGRNEGSPSVNHGINSRLWNIACDVSTESSVSAVETAYQNNEYEWKPFNP